MGLIRAFCLALCLAAPLAAQELSGLARLDIARSDFSDSRQGVEARLYLSQPAPYRVFTLDDPRRLVIDFREVDFGNATEALLDNADAITGLRFGPLRPGWSRLVAGLAAPLVLEEAGMETDESTGTALITLRLAEVSEAEFAARVGAPAGPDWASDLDLPAEPALDQSVGAPLRVVIDPGHGGIDPGAERGGLEEADLMLLIADELSEALTRAGLQPILTRTSDLFVPLEERLTIARTNGADLFLSLHADALAGEQTTGASVYTLSAGAGDAASARMAERHNSDDLLSGVDLTGEGDRMARLLMDLARAETGPQSARLADALVAGLRETGATLNSRPRREARLAVLNAADFPAVLVEVGFLSSEADRMRLTDPEARALIVDGLVRGILRWRDNEEALRPLIRQ